MEILDFYADWCGPCQMMKPIMEEFEKAHPEVKITAVNIDEDEEIADKYGVSGIPCIVILKDGKEINRAVGVQPLKKLEKMIGK
ncbi:thioredoxin [Candidatus Saccharibacteria bacterium]|nr:thioredoxin [Candidatus Saccharibacteria bacterium]MBR3254453.1 thioredoxin [Candidatus Saccharibacteria bacterium]